MNSPSFSRTGLHLIRVGGGLLLVALAVASVLVVASLLAVVGLVASLGAGVGILLTVAVLAEGIGCGLLLLRRDVGSSEGSHPAGLLEDEPQVSDPQDQVDEAESLWSRESRGGGARLFQGVTSCWRVERRRDVGTYHGGVEAGHLGVVDLTAAVLLFVAG